MRTYIANLIGERFNVPSEEGVIDALHWVFTNATEKKMVRLFNRPIAGLPARLVIAPLAGVIGTLEHFTSEENLAQVRHIWDGVSDAILLQ